MVSTDICANSLTLSVLLSQFLPSLPFSSTAGHLLVVKITKKDALNFVSAWLAPHA